MSQRLKFTCPLWGCHFILYLTCLVATERNGSQQLFLPISLPVLAIGFISFFVTIIQINFVLLVFYHFSSLNLSETGTKKQIELSQCDMGSALELVWGTHSWQ